jgi:uncharacterized protein YlaI
MNVKPNLCGGASESISPGGSFSDDRGYVCPICGGSARITFEIVQDRRVFNDPYYYYVCDYCGSRSGKSSDKKVVRDDKYWNKRKEGNNE